MFKKFFLVLTVLIFGAVNFIKADVPLKSFEELLVQAEINPAVQIEARQLAGSLGHPFEIYTTDGIHIIALEVQNGKVVYGVIHDLANPYNGSELAFYEQITARFNLEGARQHFADGTVTNPTLGFPQIEMTDASPDKFLMILYSSNQTVLTFNPENGDLINSAYIVDGVNLSLPQHAVLSPRATITISDQSRDGIFEYDTTSGSFIRLFAPAGGVDPAIFDNVRGHAYKPNGHVLGTVGSGPNVNVIPEFDTSGVYVGPFLTTGVTAGWFIIYRPQEEDILVTSINSPSGVTRFNYSGTLLGTFASISNFPQQIHEMSNRNIAVSNFSLPANSGVLLFGPDGGTFYKKLSVVTSNRGVWELGNGNLITTNSSGIHEIDTTTGALVRTIVSGIQGRLVGMFDRDMLVGINPVSNEIPVVYSLSQNYPNPFNPVTNIRFSIPESGNVSLKVFDMLGREVKNITDGFRAAGEYSVSFDATELTSGVYYYTLKAGEFSETRKMVLLK